jgi:xanthine dehydrogenase FAD-binding subunit
MYDVKTILKAKSVQEALIMLEENEAATIINGGTDVLIRMKERKLKDAALISIQDIKELCGVKISEDGSIIVGPGTTFTEISNNSIIQKYIPGLGYACSQVGSPQIRNIATIGGNICNGAVSADSVPSLLALDAILEISSSSEVKNVPIGQFHMGPGKTILNKQKELVTKIIIPKDSYENHGANYIKFGQRNAMEISTLGCAVNLSLCEDKKTIKDYRIAFGVAAATPIRCPILEKRVRGMEIGEELFKTIRKDVLNEVNPRDSWRASKELRVQLIKELSKRATKQAIMNAGGVVND